METERGQVLLTDEVMEKTPDHIKELADEVLRLNVMDLRILLDTMQAKLGIDNNQVGYGGGGRGAGNGSSGGESVAGSNVSEGEGKVKDAFDVKLNAFDAKAKIKIIKEVRAVTGLGLKEAKDLVEKTPTVIKEGLTKEEADNLVKVLNDLGGTAESV